MKYLLILMAIISFNTFSSDKVVELLKKENEELKNKIETNNELIKLRNTNSIKTKMTESDLSKNSETKYNLFLGAEAVNWGEDLEQNVPTIGFGYFVTKNISLNMEGLIFQITLQVGFQLLRILTMLLLSTLIKMIGLVSILILFLAMFIIM